MATGSRKASSSIGAPDAYRQGRLHFHCARRDQGLDTLQRARDWVAANPRRRFADPFAGRDIQADLVAYTQNQASSYLGNGKPYPAKFQQRDSVTQAPHSPRRPCRPTWSCFERGHGQPPPTK